MRGVAYFLPYFRSNVRKCLCPSCSGQAQSNRPGTGHGYENTEPECTLTVFRVPFVIRPLRSADAKSGKFI